MVGRSLSDVFLGLNADMQAVHYGFESLVAALGGEWSKGVEEKKNVRLTQKIISRLARSVCAFRPDSRHPPWRSSILPNLWPRYLQLSDKTLYVYRHLAAGIAGILVNLDLRSEIFSNYVDTSPVIVEMKKAICIDFCPS